MSRKSGRKPVGNFFVKKSLQVGLILRVCGAMILSTILTLGMIVLVYYLQHRSVLLYQLDPTGSLAKESIFRLILPSLLISTILNGLLAVALGLYASRCYAVPVYKLEQWAKAFSTGDMHMSLKFREQRQLSELSESFNALTGTWRSRCVEIKDAVDSLSETERQKEPVRKVVEFLAGLKLNAP